MVTSYPFRNKNQNNTVFNMNPRALFDLSLLIILSEEMELNLALTYRHTIYPNEILYSIAKKVENDLQVSKWLE